jgi:hypothetical protein
MTGGNDCRMVFFLECSGTKIDEMDVCMREDALCLRGALAGNRKRDCAIVVPNEKNIFWFEVGVYEFEVVEN